MPIKVGIDLVRTDEVRESLRTHGERYLQRIYTEVEQRDCRKDPRRLAARFAAKEATMKAVGRLDEPLSWRSIELSEDDTGRLCIRLTAEAAALAERRGVRHLDVSLTQRGSLAAAVVLAELEEVR
jgi:holo-[acyl-carrier protein] synthase